MDNKRFIQTMTTAATISVALWGGVIYGSYHFGYAHGYEARLEHRAAEYKLGYDKGWEEMRVNADNYEHALITSQHAEMIDHDKKWEYCLKQLEQDTEDDHGMHAL